MSWDVGAMYWMVGRESSDKGWECDWCGLEVVGLAVRYTYKTVASHGWSGRFDGQPEW